MFGKILLGAAAFAGGASLSPETKGKLRAAASGVRDDLRAATKDARAAASRGWDHARTFWYEKVLEEEPPRRPDPPAQA